VERPGWLAKPYKFAIGVRFTGSILSYCVHVTPSSKMVRVLAIICIAFLCAQESQAQYPDGTVILSSKKGLVGRIARRITGGDQYTHSAIVLNGKVYESDWPRAKIGRIGAHKRRTTNDYYIPVVPYTPYESAAMIQKANSMVGQPYQLRNYWRPGSRPTEGTWCSPFVGRVLNASGRHNLTFHDYYEPQNVLQAVGSQYQYHSTIRR